MKTKHLPTIVFWEEMKGIGNMKEIGERTQGWENLEETVSLSAISLAFQGKNYGKLILEVLEMPGTPQKQKWAAATITKQTQTFAKKQKPVTTKYFSLSHSIPTKATTTELAQKLEKHPKPIKTMFNQ